MSEETDKLCEDMETNNSDDDSSSDDDADNQFLLKLGELEKELKEKPFQYDLHIKRLELLRETGELEKLRDAREEMNTKFPLSPKLWLEWISDESKVASTQEEKQYLGKLFKRACKDYMSVEVWLEYVQYSIGELGAIGVDGVRSVFEDAVTDVGVHAAKGGLVWDAFREFESALLGGTMPDSVEYKQQRETLLKLFVRQLSVPLMEMEGTYKEFEEWLTDEEKETEEVKEGEQKYKEALRTIRGMARLEEAIQSSSSPLEIYKDYIEVENTGRSIKRIRCIYERTIAAFPIESDIWIGYLSFVQQADLDKDIIMAVIDRALRNCPWVATLWIEYLQVLEKYQSSFDKVKGVMEEALNAGFNSPADYKNLWLAYLSYLRRRMDPKELDEKLVEEFRVTAEKAVNHVYEVFGVEGDMKCEIMQLWTEVEGAIFKNMEKARLLWNDILKSPSNNNTFMWIQYAGFEKAYGDTKHCRRIFSRGLQQTTDWPEGVAAAWLIFERAHGTLESLRGCQAKAKERLQKFADEMAKQKEAKKMAKTKGRQKEVGKLKPVKFVSEGDKTTNVEEKIESKGVKRKADELNEVDSDGFKVPALPTGEVKKLKDTTSTSADQSDLSHGDEVQHDPSKDDRTVFLSNLSFTADEQEIKDHFSDVGTISELRLVKDYRGRSKGYAYLEFSSKAEAEEALKKDRSALGNRPVYVSRCEVDKSMKAPAFKYSTGLEMNKLFVKGISYSVTEDDLRNLFSEYGSLAEVRLVVHKNGKSKGFAYVDYKDEASASLALVKTDGMELQGKAISVAISNTPNRKTRPEPRPPSLGGTSREQASGGSRGRGRTQLAMLPRSITSMRPRNVGKPAEPQQNGGPRKPPTEPSTSNQLSNADFRSMLLGGNKS